MMDTIKLLREQTVLCRHALELFNTLIEELRDNSPSIIETVGKIEKVTRDLNEIADKKISLENLNSVQKNVAESLLKQSEMLQTQIKEKISIANDLVKKGAEFVTYNMNLFSHTKADTYSADKLTENSRRIVEFRC